MGWKLFDSKLENGPTAAKALKTSGSIIDQNVYGPKLADYLDNKWFK